MPSPKFTTSSLPGAWAGASLFSSVRNITLAAFFALALAACGGGGSDTGSTTPPDSAASGVTTFAVTPTLSGVAAVGAPLTNALVKVIDGSGAPLGTATTKPADGSYSLSLSNKVLKLPLLIQATGIDASGNPQVLHSAVPVLDAAKPAMVANITPLSNAIVALAMGSDPQPAFASSAASAAAMAAPAASAASAAGEFVKTLIKTQLSDLKITNTAALDLLGDASFTANKSAQDLLLESLRVQLSKNSKGVEQLLISNKLINSANPEVQVSLGAAQTELLKSTGAAPATAITSTLKLASTAKATLDNLPLLDELAAGLNSLIAQGKTAADFKAATQLAAYSQHDSADKDAMAAKLADFAVKKGQLGRFMVTGCADDALVAGLCKKVLISANVTDSSGALLGQFSDAASFTKGASASTPGLWGLVGNGRNFAMHVYPVNVIHLGPDANVTAASPAPNPWVGIQVAIQGMSNTATPAKIMDTATVQLQSGYSIPFAYCGRPLLCISDTPGAKLVKPTGSIAELVLRQSALGWLGSAESQRGAKYSASFTLDDKPLTETRSAYLLADVPAVTPVARFPAIDGLSSSQPLTTAALRAGLTINFSNWAAANPDMRLISVRALLDGFVLPLYVDYEPPSGGKTALVLAPVAWPSSATMTVEFWLGAQDAAGRRYYTRYALATQ
ncbi:hypothetical protein [Roseateles oligotrophus]|uniref:Carboxypeptidase regulatory-like domain-containing protein n=1 Tax=Roseateles oligotrophus TaxID=1769250 RepID=A0ABT2YKZ2_9BURK|nr:hypothetical protein [Roseateles oligotrophus]MCV2370736.1 hypothetical protein [Roseateles oligotrophus]